MATITLPRPSARRWAMVAAVVVALLGLGQQSLHATTRQPSLGLRAIRTGEHLRIAWVQPAGPAWDDGVRPGDVVVALGGQPVTPQDDPTAVATASVVQVRSASGTVVTATASTVLSSPVHRLSFVAIAFCFLVVGAIVFVLAADVLVASVFLGFAVTAAAMLVGAIATPFGVSWALAVVYVAVVGFGASTFLLFLVFPINRLGTRIGRLATTASFGISLVLIGLYAWAITVDPTLYDALKVAMFLVVAGELLGAIALVLVALPHTLDRRRARRALELVVVGAAYGLAPFCLLSLGPYVLGVGYLVSPDLAILSVVLLPISLGGAVLSRQFLGIDRILRRGIIALVVWLGLLGFYSVGLDTLRYRIAGDSGILEAALTSTVVRIAIVNATFPILQAWLRRRLERALFHDVYDYAETLQQLSADITRLTGIEEITTYVLTRLGQTLDLRWGAIALRADPLQAQIYGWGECSRDLDAVTFTTNCSTFSEVAYLSSSGSAACGVPLVADGKTIGALLVGPKRHDVELLSEDRALITTVGPLVATVLQNALLIQDLERQVTALGERECALQALSVRLMRVQEEERRRIALDLHDDPLQRLILLVRELKGEPGDARSQRWCEEVEAIAVAIRAICAGLHPPQLDDLGLVGALNWLTVGLAGRSDLAVSLVVETADGGPFGQLAQDLEIALYRAAQEALNNCFKHAQATNVTVTLWRDECRIRLSIADDGQGPCNGGERGGEGLHLGIIGIRERVRPWGGTVSLEACSTGGTIVRVEVPWRGDNGRSV